MAYTKGALPKAYLRIDPNVDLTVVDLAGFVRLLCMANRQPRRGFFKSEELVRSKFGKKKTRQLVDDGHLVPMDDGSWYVAGWMEWQEGNHPVGDRMQMIRTLRSERDTAAKSGAERTREYRIRREVLERDNYTCRYCGTQDNPRWLVADHIDPKGYSLPENLATACRPCNKRKGSKTLLEVGMKLLPVLVTSHSDTSLVAGDV